MTDSLWKFRHRPYLYVERGGFLIHVFGWGFTLRWRFRYVVMWRPGV